MIVKYLSPLDVFAWDGLSLLQGQTSLPLPWNCNILYGNSWNLLHFMIFRKLKLLNIYIRFFAIGVYNYFPFIYIQTMQPG